MKKRVIYLMRRAVGGMQTHVLDLAASLPKDRYEVRVVAPPSTELEKRLSSLRIPFMGLPLTDNLTPLRDLGTILRCRSILKEYSPHILHIHGNKAALVGRIAAWGLSLPVVVVTVHNLLKYQSKPGLKQILSARVDHYLSRQTDAIISVSRDLAQDLINKEKLPSSKIRVVYNGIDWQDFEVTPKARKKIRESFGFNSKELVVGMIARLAPQKSPLNFVAAAKNLKTLPQAKFLLVGDGPLAKEVREEIGKSGLSQKLLLTGFRRDIPQILSAIDIFVLSSKWEGFPYILEEAMAAGKPVIATEVGGVPELIKPGQNGLLVPPSDKKAITQALLKLFNDSNLRTKLSLEAKETIKRDFSRGKMVEETVEIYEGVLAQKKNQFKI